MSYYDYKELRDKALETRAQADIDALADWMQHYGDRYWNGTTYDIDDGYRLRPIYKLSDAELEEYEITGWKIE